MAEAKTGEAFVTHELDEAIAIQRAIVDAEERLSSDHPRPAAQQLIRKDLKNDQRFLKQLEELGRTKGATGRVEEVAGSLEQLMTQTTEKAAEAESEAYEAHAVLLNLKRKQQDSAQAMIKMARAMKDDRMRDAAVEFEKETKQSAQELASELAELAVAIATNESASQSAGSSR